MKKEGITREMIERKMEEMAVLMGKYEGDDKADLAESLCFEVVNQCADTHYEAMGIIIELMYEYRRASLQTMKDMAKEEGKENEEGDDDEEEDLNTEDIPDECLCEECQRRKREIGGGNNSGSDDSGNNGSGFQN